jgi:hypothetical protein
MIDGLARLPRQQYEIPVFNDKAHSSVIVFDHDSAEEVEAGQYDRRQEKYPEELRETQNLSHEWPPAENPGMKTPPADVSFSGIFFNLCFGRPAALL